MKNNILVSNVWGLGTSHKRLRVLEKKYSINLVAILESFIKEIAINKIGLVLGLTKSYSNGARGGKI